MGSFTYRTGVKFILSLIGIFLIGSLPALFNGVHLDFGSYFSQLTAIIPDIVRPWEWTYTIEGISRSLFPKILDPWAYSMTLLFGSFFIAFLAAIVFAYVTLLLPRKLIDGTKFILFSLESLPDVLVIAIFQIAVIWMYQKTGILMFYIAEYGDHQPYTLPIIALSILPTIFMYRIFILDLEEESEQPYVELAKAKGLKHYAVLLKHILRNAIMGIFLHSKFILWIMLSNLLVVEYIFAISGLIQFMISLPTPQIFTIGIILLFVPIFIIMSIGQFIIEKVAVQKVVL
ncbi:ABC transporter permease subunit [Virgibacillus siamensis]|uniref:ABC transporter permease subunit n=1 Tax=Virgibacillus siamensis TaxID=480071 RepID=UPI000984C792|nr:ABC transporter permease subunit [Virgibacillus siamensis]